MAFFVALTIFSFAVAPQVVRAEAAEDITTGLEAGWNFNDGFAPSSNSGGGNPMKFSGGSYQDDFSSFPPDGSSNNTYVAVVDGSTPGDGGLYVVDYFPANLTSYGINFWINPDAVDAGTIFGSNSDGAVRVETTATNQVQLVTETSFPDPSTDFTITSTGTLPTTGWTHVYVQRIGTTVNIYLDGVLDTTDTDPTRTGSLGVGAGGCLTLGMHSFDCDDSFGSISQSNNIGMLIDDVRLYDDIHTTAEIAMLAAFVPAPAPGGVDSDLALWLKADAGTTTATGVSNWADQSGNGNDVSQATGSAQPTLIGSDMNFNPSLDFDGSNSILSDADGILGTGTYSDSYVFVVQDADTIANDSYSYIEEDNGGFFYGALPWSDGEIYSRVDTTSLTAGYAHGPWGTTVNKDHLWSMITRDTAPEEIAIKRDGSALSITNTATNTFTGSGDQMDIGGYSGASDQYLDGQVSEMVVYLGAKTDTEIQQIESYLALKYGITLDSSAGTYKSSAGTDIYNLSTYSDDVFGIGADNGSELDQKVSRSINASDGLILATTQDFTSANSDVGRASLDDGDFVMMGHNAGTKDSFTSSYDGGANNASDRVWKVGETGTVGDVFIAVPLAQIANMPSGGAPAIVTSSDTTFDTTDEVTALTYDFANGLYYAEINPDDGDYLSLVVSEITVAQPAYYRNSSSGSGSNGVTVYPTYVDFIANTNGSFIAYTQEWGYGDKFFVDGAYVYRTNNAINQISRYPSIQDLGANQNGIDFTLSQTWGINDEFFASGNEFYRGGSISGTGTDAITTHPSFADLVANTNGVQTNLNVNWSFDDQFMHDGQYFIRTNTNGGAEGVTRYESLANLAANNPIDFDNFTSGGSAQTWSVNDDMFALGITADYTVSETALTVDENAGTGTFTVVLDAQPQTDVVFGITSDATGEATVAPTTLTFTSSDWDSAQTVTVTGVDDAVTGDDTATTTIAINAGASDNSFDSLTDETVIITLTNDDVPSAPGGVSTDLGLWMRADIGVTNTGDGTTATAWADQSGNGNDTTSINGAPTYRTSTTINFNSVIDFDGNGEFYNLPNSTLPTGNNPYSVFGVGQIHTATGNNGAFVGVTGSAVSNGFHMGIVSGTTVLNNWRTTQLAGPSGIVVDTPYIMGYAYEAATGADDVFNYLNGEIGNSIDETVVRNTLTTSHKIGNSFAGDNDWNGLMGEVISYNRKLTDTERQKVDSYLAIKYGITLDQSGLSGGTSYIASDGSEMWTQDTNDNYEFHIFGIGRDDASELGQVKSKSVNPEAIVTVEAEGEGTNAANAFTDIADLEFLTIGNDDQLNDGNAWYTGEGGTLANFATLERSWRSQQVGDVGTVQIDVDVADADFDLPAPLDGGSYYFIQDTDGDTDFDDETPVAMTDQGGDVWRITGISFGANEKFTFGSGIPAAVAPGGVSADLNLWLKANDASSITETSGNVSAWNSQFGSNQATAPVASNEPSLIENHINFNPAIDFKDGDEYLGLDTQIPSLDTTMFGVARRDNDGGIQTFWKSHNYNSSTGDHSAIIVGGNLGYWNNGGNRTTIETWADQETHLFAGALPTTDNNFGQYAVDGGTYENTSTVITTGTDDYQDLGNTNSGNPFNFGEIAESIIYDTNSLSSTDRQKIESYLALKYGITLNAGATDYLASDGTETMWVAADNAGYTNDIAGIGLDDGQGLDQRVSKSVNSDSLVAFALDNNFTAANNDVARGTTHAADMSFMTWANDNATSTAPAWTATGAPALRQILDRKWKVDETGTVGTVYISVPDDSATGTTLPTEDTAVYLLTKTANDDFSTGATETALTLNGDKWELPAGVNLADAQYFTFATANVVNLAPVFEDPDGFDVSAGAHAGAGEEYNVGATLGSEYGLAFNNDGTKMYVSAIFSSAIAEFDLLAPFDVASASHVYTLTGLGGRPIDIAFNDDGSKLYYTGNSSTHVREYNLGTNFDLSTAAFDKTTTISETINTYAISFNDDGSQMYILDRGSDRVLQYSLSSNYDPGTLTYVKEFNVGTEQGNPMDVLFNPDGTKMFILGLNQKNVDQYNLSIPFDIGSATHAGEDKGFVTASFESNPYSFAFNNDGTELFTTGFTGKVVTFITQPVIEYLELATSAVTDVNANDGDGGSTDVDVTFSLVSGGDNDLFNINTATGELTFITPPSYSSPSDADTNNDYEITVVADDGQTSDNTASRSFIIRVTQEKLIELSAATGASSDEVTADNLPVLLVSGVFGSSETVELVDLATGDATEGAGNDYVFTSPTTITIPSGTYDGTVGTAVSLSGLTLVDNAIIENNETIDFQIQSPSGEVSISDVNEDATTQSSFTYTITDDDTAGFTVTPTVDVAIAEGATNATAYSVVLNAEPTSDVQVDVSSGNAALTADTITLTFTSTNWDTAQDVSISAPEDTNLVSEQDVVMTFAVNDAGSDDTFDALADQIRNVDVTDNDAATIVVTPTGITINENAGSDTFTVVLGAEPSSDVVIDLTSTDTAEGTVSPAALTFTTANWNTVQTVTITGVNDDIDRDDTVNITVAVNDAGSDNAFDAVANETVVVTLTDDDTAGFSVTPTADVAITEGATTATAYSVVLLAQPVSDVVIDISSGHTSVTADTASLTFTNANWDTAQDVSITASEDANLISEQDIVVTFTINDAGSDDTFDALTDQTRNVDVTDNDTATIVVTPTGITINENVGSDTFTVVLGAQPASDVVIDLTSASVAEGTVSPATLTFTTANWDTPQTVTITGVDDNVISADTVDITVSVNDASSDDAFDAVADETVAVTLTDDDTAGFTVTPTIDVSVTEGATNATAYSVVLTAQPTTDVVIDISSGDASVTADTASLTFTSANWSAAQDVSVTAPEDDNLVSEQDVTMTFAINDAGSDDAFDAVPDATRNVDVTDNDTATIVVTPAGITINENAGSDTFTVVLGAQPASDVVIDLTSADLAQGTVSPATLTFTTANWDTPQTVTITGVDDNVISADTVDITVSVNDASSDDAFDAVADETVAVTLTDDDATDTDNDGISDATEAAVCAAYPTIAGCTGSNPEAGIDPSTDTDGDGIPDATEYFNGDDPTDANDPVTNGDGDDDNDGVSNGLETVLCATYPTLSTCVGTAPSTTITLTSDADGDGVPDWVEFLNGSDPSDVNSPITTGGGDTDNDGISNALESALCTLYPTADNCPVGDPEIEITPEQDTDGDGVSDITELLEGTDPSDATSFLDTDNDGVSDHTEKSSFNAGDGDGDGIPDYTQQEVSSALNPVTGGPTTIKSGGADCTFITENAFVAEDSLAAEDTSADYPVGLVDFQVQCTNPGDSADITLYYAQEYDTSEWLYKKYDSSGNAYADITSLVTYGTADVGGTDVTTASFTVTDGDPQTDEDGVADGLINDPSGPAVVTSVPVYRFWSDTYQSHFYTRSETEKDSVIADYDDAVWRYEGIAFQAYESTGADRFPVYRFWSDEYKAHFYTSNQAEKFDIQWNTETWEYEGVDWYASGSGDAVYRFYSKIYQSHFYTTSVDERDSIVANDPNWVLEGEVRITSI